MEAMNFKPEGSVISIHPLFITKKDSYQAPRISERIYRPGVLEGNWFEDSTPVTPVAKDQWASLCETSYRPYKTELLTRPKFEAWEQRILNQGVGARLLIDHDGTKYHNNWTTTNDLSFKILPQGLDGPWHRKFNARCNEWLPSQDYAKVYGNMTEYGLAEFMRHKWLTESNPPRPWRTNYQDDFPNYEHTSSVR
ncbi:uncharacterized protein LOC124405556 [Diprion similis]|uniref:uncharacterized protein LOC124405556 n=1 Tax=Diprion similis TaxID=362088 RepID=UPI001EF788B4|nr:uncharacterized protein LOC124405556 [Diprion similis]